MTLPSGFIETADALPLHIVSKSTYSTWLQTQPSHVQHWLSAQRFDASAGSLQTWADAQGQLAAAVAGVEDTLDPYAYAHIPRALPDAHWRAEGEALNDDARHALQLGWGLGLYRFSRYKTHKTPDVHLLGPFDPEIFNVLAACLRVRDLVNTPTEHMGPDELEAVARSVANTHGAQLSVIAGDALLTHNYPAIHAVGRASHRAPRLLELTWGDTTHPHIAICGKGVCFDTGGLDLKAAAGMRNMKKDMGGAAHALALAELIMAQQLPLRLTLLIPAVENAVGPNAFRPGEVVSTRKGVSVEIDNTDAEGRMVLCDTLTRACELKPDVLLDFAFTPMTKRWPMTGSAPAPKRATRFGGCHYGAPICATSPAALPTSPTPATPPWPVASPPRCI
jgi:leucyl aminopeptidase